MLGMELPEITEIFKNFSPTQLIYNRVDASIRIDISDLENISLSIFSDF